jgi:hypothetical protein
MSDKEWDHKHGLHGWKRGDDYDADTGTTHSSASLSNKQVRARIYELFGKTQHSQEQRLMGIPTHLAQVQALLKNLQQGIGSGGIKAAEKDLRGDLSTALMGCGIDVPPLGMVFPASSTLVIFWRYNNAATVHERYIAEGDLDDTYKTWAVSGTDLGAFYKTYGVYKAWTYYKNIAPPTVTAQNVQYTVVGNFFGSGLQWEGWSAPD